MPKKGDKKQQSMMTTPVEELMRMLVEERAQRDTEFTRREREVQTQMATMQQHMESLLRVVSDTTARPSPVNRPVDVKLVPLSEKDDIEAYLVTFERIMAAHEIRQNQWPYHLAPKLTGKAQLAFAALPPAEARDYDAIKAAILARYDINEEAYRLVDLRNKWMRNCSSVEDVAEVICLEQFYETLPADMRTWVRDKKPRTCKQAGELADEFVQTRQTGPSTVIRAHKISNQIGHFAKNCPVADKMTVAKMTKRNVRVLNQCHKLRQVTQVLQAKVKVNRTMLSAISVDNEVTFPPSAHHQLCFVSWNSSHQFINLAQRQPLCVGVDK